VFEGGCGARGVSSSSRRYLGRRRTARRHKLLSVADEARKYSSGTKAALFALGKGTCYFPDCTKPVVEETEGLQLVAVQIAHIGGANEGSARYDAAMSDTERAAFSNLMLMCTTHHKLIDGPKSSEYSAELLQKWKTDHEPGIGALPEGNITADNLEEVLESLMAKIPPVREIAIDLEASLWIPGNTMKMPFRDLSILLENNAHLRTCVRGVVTTVRNTGTADVTVAEVTLVQVMGDPNAPGAEFTLMGRNDFLPRQKLPHRLPTGDALEWLTKSQTIAMCEAAATSVGKQYSALYTKVRLASGAKIESQRIPWSEVNVVLTDA
jgi:hypothetical protein